MNDVLIPVQQLITKLQNRVEELENAIGEMSTTHQEPDGSYGWYSECNGCGENLDKNKHDDDCPFVLAKVVTQK